MFYQVLYWKTKDYLSKEFSKRPAIMQQSKYFVLRIFVLLHNSSSLGKFLLQVVFSILFSRTQSENMYSIRGKELFSTKSKFFKSIQKQELQ